MFHLADSIFAYWVVCDQVSVDLRSGTVHEAERLAERVQKLMEEPHLLTAANDVVSLESVYPGAEFE